MHRGGLDATNGCRLIKPRCSGLGLDRIHAGALRDDLACVLVKGASLRDGFYRLLHLRVGFQLDLEAFLLAEGGEEDFLLDLALDPVEILAEFGFCVMDVVLAQIGAEVAHYRVIDFKALGNRWARAEIIAGKATHASLEREEDVGAQQALFKLVEFRRRNIYVCPNPTPIRYLAAPFVP